MPTPWEEAAQLKNQPASDESWTGSAIGAVKDFGRGVGKGVVGDVVGAGQLLDPVARYVAPGTTEAIEKAGQGVKDWATSPSASASESLGKFGGGALPFMLVPEASLGSLAARAGIGALAGGVQPTESGTAGSHLAGMAGGALGGAALSPALTQKVTQLVQGGSVLAAAEFAGRHLGVSPWVASEILGIPLYLAFRKPTALSRLAQKGMAKVPPQMAAPAGAGGGQVGGAIEQNLSQ